MREKIRVDRLEIGMHVESLCGKWIDHPFWRTRFLVRNERELAALRASGVAECWIDRSKGVERADASGVPAHDRVPPMAAEPADADAQPLASGAAGRGEPALRERGDDPALRDGSAQASAPGLRYEDEVERAAVVCAQAARATQSLFREARLGRAIELERCAEVARQIAASATRNPSALVSLARVRTHHSYTFMHSIAVCALMTALARQLGFDEAATRDAALAGLLHDIGKTGVGRELLDKPGRLSDEEFVAMQQHPRIGHRMLSEKHAVNEVVLLACLHHHERYDGDGYPARLAGEAIPYAARMNALCDVYDAITSLRAYKEPWDPAESIAKMAAWTKAGQFDPALFRAFANTVGIYPVGSLVRMKSERLGIVIDQNPQLPAQPCVKIFWSTRKSLPVRVERVDLADAGVGDRIVARESNAQWGFKHLPELLMGEEIHRQLAGGVMA
ncbi:MAG: HD-GYP domain-containing protein [Burkholderiaceae bacterium]|nr:HD-GYP domain-containing protein [Burkholderiaceae bacterium]